MVNRKLIQKKTIMVGKAIRTTIRGISTIRVFKILLTKKKNLSNRTTRGEAVRTDIAWNVYMVLEKILNIMRGKPMPDSISTVYKTYDNRCPLG